MDRLDHQFEGRIDYGPRLFGVEILHHLGGSLDVGEQRRGRLALAVHSRGAIRLPQCERGSGRLRFAGRGSKRDRTLAAELESRRILEVALWTDQRERLGALTAKFHSLRIFETAF